MERILLSVCCDAEVLMGGKTTRYYVCVKCGEACDVTMETPDTKKAVRRPRRDKMVRAANDK